jgi:hypothetical protein
MRRIVLALVPLTILAACSSEPAEEPVAEETVAAEASELTAANGSPAGTYEATAADGTVTTTTLNADGTYTDVDAEGATLAEGTWAVTDGKTCFTPTTEGVPPMCYTESAPAADGSFTATPDEGEPLTVRPAAVAAPAAEEAPAE